MPIPPCFIHPTPTSTYAVARASSSLLAAALARDLWRRTPQWVRDDDLCKSWWPEEEESTTEGHKDEMASLAAVIQKLQSLILKGYEKLGSERRVRRRRRVAGIAVGKSSNRTSPKNDSIVSKEDSLCASPGRKQYIRKSTSECICQNGASSMCYSCKTFQEGEQVSHSFSMNTDRNNSAPISPLEWHAALLAYLQLSNQMKERFPSWRDRLYLSHVGDLCVDSSDEIGIVNNLPTEPSSRLTISLTEIKVLQKMLDYAVWAYEPDGDVLRNLLSNNHSGYQLLVHRTSSYFDPSRENCDGKTIEKSVTQSTKQSSRKKQLRKPPGRVGYYVAISHSQKSLLIGMKGTSTLEEILTDCCGRAVRLDLKSDPHIPSPVRYPCADDEESQDTLATLYRSNSSIEDAECDTDRVNLKSNVSMTSGNDAVSQLEIIEVQLIELQTFETKANKVASANDTSTITSNRSEDRTKVNFNSISTASPAENILLVPSNQSLSNELKALGAINNEKYRNSTPWSQLSIPHDEFMENSGIEMQTDRSTKLRGAHEGILHCAQQLFFEISPLLDEYAVSKGYNVVCTGHSLGAGTACLLSLLIRGKYPELVIPREGKNHLNSNYCAQETIERVQAYAFASPPVLDRASALACRHYVTSIVNNSDIIPRSSLTNLDVLLTMLEAVRTRLFDLGMNPGWIGKDAENAPSDICRKSKSMMTSLVALFRKLSQGTEGDLLIEPTELRELWEEAVADASIGDDGIYWDEEGDHHLFVPGKLLVMFAPWTSSVDPYDKYVSDNDDAFHDDKIMDDHGTKNEETENDDSVTYRAIWTDGTASMLKGFEVGAGGSMVTDHLTSSYYRALKSLEQRLADDSYD